MAWQVLGASEAGSSHLRFGKGCEDAFAAEQDAEAVYVAVADGAGSARFAARASQLAVTAAVDAAKQHRLRDGAPATCEAWRAFLEHVLHATRLALEEELRILEVLAGDGEPGVPGSRPTFRDLSTTLLFVAADDRGCGLVQVGDGVIVFEDDAELRAMTKPDHGEYVNETVFLTSDGFAQRAQYGFADVDSVTGFVVTTDGLQSLATVVATNQVHEPFFRPLLAFARGEESDEYKHAELARFLQSDRVCARTDDDKTLVIAFRKVETSR